MPKLSVEQTLSRAKSLSKKGAFAQAQALYEEVLSQFPSNTRAQQGLASLIKSRPSPEITRLPQNEMKKLVELYEQNDLEQVIQSSIMLTKRHPNAVFVWNILGVAWLRIGKTTEAANAFFQATKIYPEFADAHENLGIAFRDQGKNAQAIAAFNKALSLNPDRGITYFHLGIAHRANGDPEQAINAFSKAISINPADAEAHNNLGIVLQEQNQFAEAVQAYNKALLIRPDFADAQYNKGNALKCQGKLNEAIEAFKETLAIRPEYAKAQNNLGVVLQELGRLDEAFDAYRAAVTLKPEYAEAHYNQGNVSRLQGDMNAAMESTRIALSIKPNYAEALNNLGVSFQYQAKLVDAVESYKKALSLEPNYVEAWANLSVALQDLGRLEEAIDACEQALKLKPDDISIKMQLLHQKQHAFDLSAFDTIGSFFNGPEEQIYATPPFPKLSWIDSAEVQHRHSQEWAKLNYPTNSPAIFKKTTTRPKRIKLGYFSADFHDHATMHLMSGLLREHDKSQFELFAYSYGRSSAGSWRVQAEQSVDNFFDISDYSDAEIVDLARSHALDIAIDLKGYTQQTRSNIFQYHLAPIQINFLGYPGSLGTSFIDYIIADPVVLPPEHAPYFSEKIIWLPHSYQPNDDTRVIPKTNTKRSDFGLPEDAFTFCCFNNTYKISPIEFDIWMRLMHRLDNSVLWLFKPNNRAEQNLRKEAELRGIEPERIIFADKLPHSEHLARHQHADLFIDTFNVNAHTTASDALWTGLPLVTKRGNQFASRVGASLLSAVGLPELITKTNEDYEMVIFEIASEPERLAALRQKLAANRLSEPLFNTELYTRNFELGLVKAFDRYFNANKPEDIVLQSA